MKQLLRVPQVESAPATSDAEDKLHSVDLLAAILSTTAIRTGVLAFIVTGAAVAVAK